MHQPAFAQHQHFLPQLETFVQAVGHQKHGRLEIRTDLAQHFIEFRPQRGIQTLRGLVEQQQFGCADQRAGDRAALALAAGYFVRTPSRGIHQPELFEHLVHAAMAFQARPALGCELQVLAQRHVREQGVVLKHVSAVAGLWRRADACRTVEENFIVEQNAAFIRTHEAGDQIERERLAGPAGSEENRNAGGRLKFELERECRGIRPGGDHLV